MLRLVHVTESAVYEMGAADAVAVLGGKGGAALMFPHKHTHGVYCVEVPPDDIPKLIEALALAQAYGDSQGLPQGEA